MAIMKFIDKYRKQFLFSRIDKMKITNFGKSKVIRRHLIFTGKVQGVGFRVEALGIAKRLNLVGWVKNKRDGSVELNVEGPANKIDFMVNYLSNINRAPVEDVFNETIEVLNSESEFNILY